MHMALLYARYKVQCCTTYDIVCLFSKQKRNNKNIMTSWEQWNLEVEYNVQREKEIREMYYKTRPVIWYEVKLVSSDKA